VSCSISRRDVLWGVPLALLATRARAQTGPKLIGILSPYATADVEPVLVAFRQAMRDLGYAEGRGYNLVQRLADGHQERLPALAAELVKLRVDLILASTTNAVKAANAATSTIPIVFESVADPVGAGVAQSISHPGRNVTGLSNFSIDLSAKRFQLLTQLLPALRDVEVLANPANAYYATQKPAIESVADKLGLRVNFSDASTPEEIEQAFRAMAARRAMALIVTADAYLYARRRQIATLALSHRLASVFPFAASVDAGGLMSYGVDPAPPIRQAAVFVDKIFKGATPGDLPIEQPTRVEMVINRRTAALLRLTIPPALLLQAERVID
jgi:putative ABC transport system substrate-binding protein